MIITSHSHIIPVSLLVRPPTPTKVKKGLEIGWTPPSRTKRLGRETTKIMEVTEYRQRAAGVYRT
jgi:hypothetical protein